MRALLAVLLLCAASVPPAEVDARAEAIGRGLRCVVCKNQSITDSDAALAGAMRDLVRERVEAGDTDEEVRAYMVARYGEFVLLRPTASARNLWLWAGPFAMLAAAAMGGVLFVRGQGGAAPPAAPLSEDERVELARLRAQSSNRTVD